MDFLSCDFVLQAEVENLSLKERTLDDQIRFMPLIFFLKSILLSSNYWKMLMLLHFCREMQEKLRDLSEDENNRK